MALRLWTLILLTLCACAKEPKTYAFYSVDILFVVDNSGSMSTHQSRLADGIGQFTGEFMTRTNVLYRIGVVTTDNGTLQGSNPVVNRHTVGRDSVLAENLKVGTSGSPTERPLQYMREALETNEKFLRQEAKLVVIFLTDADDQSSGTATEYFDYLVNLKGGEENIYTLGAIIASSDTNPSCSRDGAAPVKLEEFLALTSRGQNNIIDLCSTDYGNALASAAVQIIGIVTNNYF